MKKLNIILLLAVVCGSCKSEPNIQADSSKTTGSAKSQSSTLETVYASRTIDFTRVNGGYSQSYYLSDFGNDDNQNGTSSVSTAEAGRMYTESNALRVKLLANQIGDAGGMWAYTAIGRSTTTKVLQYDVKFGYVSAPFDWSIGGKIPGLGGGANYSGCVSSADGNGWTSRIMWRKASDGRAYLMPYVYYIDKPASCGDDFGLKYYGGDSAGLQSGRWYRVRMEITLNTTTSYNGILKITVQEYVGGVWSSAQTLINKTNIRFATTTAGLEIDQLLTGVYRGGSTTDWASATDGYIFLDNVSWSN